MFGEIGSIANRLKIYKNNVLRNKKKKIKIDKKKQTLIIKHKKQSKPKTFFMILVGFIFGFFENIADKSSKNNAKNVNKDNKENEQNGNNKGTINVTNSIKTITTQKIKLNYINENQKKLTYNNNKITYVSSAITIENKKEEFSNNNNKQVTNQNLKSIQENIKKTDSNAKGIEEQKNINSTNLKKQDNKINENDADSQNLSSKNLKIDEIDSTKNENCNLDNSKNNMHNTITGLEEAKAIKQSENDTIIKVEEQSKENSEAKPRTNELPNEKQSKSKKEVLDEHSISDEIDKEDIEKGMLFITKALKEQKKFIDKEMEVLKNYKGKINDKLKINYFSIFVNSTFNFMASILPIGVFKNKLFGSLVSGILLNNSIKTMRNEMNLKNNATIIVPEYLKQIEKQSDTINSIYDVCVDSLEQFDLLKTEFTIKNHMYSSTPEYKNAMQSLATMERQIKKSLEEAENLLKTKKEIEKQTKKKIYKIVRS